MNREDSARLASWLSLALGALTLLVALLALAAAAIALLSIDQVKRLACRSFTIDCEFDDFAAALLTFDVEPRDSSIPAPLDELDLAPPGSVSSATATRSPAPTAWNVLVREAEPASAVAAVNGLLLGTGEPPSPDCLSLGELATFLKNGNKDVALVGARNQWKVNYIVGPIDEGVLSAGKNGNPRSLGFEFTARYRPLHRKVDLTLRMLAFDSRVIGHSVFPERSWVYKTPLPINSTSVDYLCRLPDFPAGEHTITLESEGSEGDWKKAIASFKLDVRSIKTAPAD
jgi:hypothetical protein